jgi:hypothetical protein
MRFLFAMTIAALLFCTVPPASAAHPVYVHAKARKAAKHNVPKHRSIGR